MRKLNIFKKKSLAISLLLVFAVLAVFAGGKAVANWGPNRNTYTWAHPADHITFNSITDNPVVGDERPFLSGSVPARSATAVDNVQVQENDEVALRVYFHNNAAANLNLVATNTRVAISLPTVTATSMMAGGFVYADNATPQLISDTVDFTGARPFSLEYVKGSARLVNNVFTGDGVQISDSVVSNDGALVGYNAIDGKVPGCEQFSGYVFIRLKVKMQPAPEVPKYACTLLDVKAQTNRRVDANVTYTNSGGATFKNVSFDWGDGSTPLLTTNTGASYTYAKDGTYTIKATVRFNVNGTEQSATSVDCTKQVTFTTPAQPAKVTPTPTKPAALPNTGPGSVAALFAGISTIAGAFHYLWNRKSSVEL